MRLCLCAVAGVILLAAGCAQPYVRRVEPPLIPAPLVKRIPLTLGVHYTSEFRSARPISTVYIPQVGALEEMWLIGEPSVVVFDAALRGMFENVVEVKQWPLTDGPLQVAGVLIPSIPRSAVQVGPDPNIQYRVRYRLELCSKSGENLGAWEVVGVSGLSEVQLVRGSTIVRDAMRSAAAALVVSFFRDPQARAWLEANGVRPDALR